MILNGSSGPPLPLDLMWHGSQGVLLQTKHLFDLIRSRSSRFTILFLLGESMSVVVRCSFTKMVPIGELMPHPRNPNKHSEKQIARLAQIIEYQGFRNPIKVSLMSGFITAGHGRLEAAVKLGMKEVPVDFQEYQSEEQEISDLVADNAIASWSSLDFSMINDFVGDLGPDFDIDFLGIDNFKIDVSDIEIKEKELDENLETSNECPSCQYRW